MVTVEDWAENRRLHLAEGLGKQAIAKRFGIARNTVKAALASADPPVYRHSAGCSRKCNRSDQKEGGQAVRKCRLVAPRLGAAPSALLESLLVMPTPTSRVSSQRCRPQGGP